MNTTNDKQVMSELWEELTGYIRITEQLYQARSADYRKYKKAIFVTCCELLRRGIAEAEMLRRMDAIVAEMRAGRKVPPSHPAELHDPDRRRP